MTSTSATPAATAATSSVLPVRLPAQDLLGGHTSTGKTSTGGKAPRSQLGLGGQGGKGKPAPKRHKKSKKVLKDNILGITAPGLRRLARRGGVKRISKAIYPESRTMITEFLRDVVHKVLLYTISAHRQTVTSLDVVYGLKRTGIRLFGATDTSHRVRSKA